MANYYEKIRIKTATEGTHKRTMKADTDTSIDFGQFYPIRAKIIEVGEGKIRPWTLSNMMPLPQPTFGEVRYTNRIFAVPIWQIFKGYEDYRQDVIHVTADDSSTSLQYLPYTYKQDMMRSIVSLASPSTLGNKDFTVDDNGTLRYFKHTEISAWWVKVLESLGYKFLWRINYSGLDLWNNILRLLAALKVYSDYYYNKAYRGDTEDLAMRQFFERDNGNLYYDANDLVTMARTMHKFYYNMDYFTSAWDNPNTPNITNQQTNFNILDPNTYNVNLGSGTQSNNRASVTNPNGKDPIIATDNNSITTGTDGRVGGPITNYMVKMLDKLTQFLKRNQLAGGDTLSRFLARYGRTNEDLMRKKARLIGSISWSMQVTPITSTSDTAASGGEVLGSYAGQGFAVSKEQEFSYNASEDSIIVDILTVTPIEKYVDGEDRENLIITKTELLTPEFDNLGTEPVFAAELVCPRSQGVATDSNNLYSKIFGFLPRYAYWKTMKDHIAGNYTNQFSQIYLPYTMVRRIDDNQAINSIAHSKSFTRMEDSDQYDRIFYGQPTDKDPIDNINIHHELTIEWYSYAKPLYDNYDWEHEGGREIEIQNQGNM